MGIWQDLVDGHGFTGRYASVRRFVRATAPSEPSGIITTPPGEECQVDYGEGPSNCSSDDDSGPLATEDSGFEILNQANARPLTSDGNQVER